MDLEQRIAIIVERTRTLWLIFALALSVIVIGFCPPWAWLLLLPAFYLSYYASLVIATLILASQVTAEEFHENEERQEELHRRMSELDPEALDELNEYLDSGIKEPDAKLLQLMEKAGLTEVEINPIEEHSEPFGSFDGKPLYEWIVLKNQGRFEYAGLKQDFGKVCPKGKVCADIDGIVYIRDQQPAQS